MEPKLPTPISPKVSVSMVALLGSAITLGLIDSLSPELFAFLGDWQGVAYAVVIAICTGLAGYYKTDPLRNYGAILTATHEAPDSDVERYAVEKVSEDEVKVDRVPGPDHKAE